MTLTEFEVTREADGSVSVRWATDTEFDIAGFQLWRGPDVRREQAIPVNEVMPTLGDSVTGASYQWSDPVPLDGAHYWLQVFNRDGTPEEYGPVGLEPQATPTDWRTVFLPLLSR